MIEGVGKWNKSSSSKQTLMDRKLVNALEKLVERKDFWHLSQAEILFHAQINKEEFIQCYQNKYEFLDSLNQRYVEKILENIPSVCVRKDYLRFFQKLAEMIKTESTNTLQVLFSINRGSSLPSFFSLKKRVEAEFSRRMAQSPVLSEEATTMILCRLLSNSLASAALDRNFQGFLLTLTALKELV